MKKVYIIIVILSVLIILSITSSIYFITKYNKGESIYCEKILIAVFGYNESAIKFYEKKRFL